MSTSSSKFREHVIPLRELTMGDVLTVDRGELIKQLRMTHSVAIVYDDNNAIRVWGRQQDVTDALQELMVHVEKWELDAAASKRRDTAQPASEASKVILLADCRPSSRQTGTNRGMPHAPTAEGKVSKRGGGSEVVDGTVETTNTAAISIVTSQSKSVQHTTPIQTGHVTQTEQDHKAISSKAPMTNAISPTKNESNQSGVAHRTPQSSKTNTTFDKVVKLDRRVLESSRDLLLEQLRHIGKKTSADCTLDDSLAIVGVNGRSTVERSAEKATASLEAWQRLRIMAIERQMKRTPSPREASATTPTTATATTMEAGGAQGLHSMTFPDNSVEREEMEQILDALSIHFMKFDRIWEQHPRGADVEVEYSNGSFKITGPAEVADEIHQSYQNYFAEVARPALETLRSEQQVLLDEQTALNLAKEEMDAPFNDTRAHRPPSDISHQEHGPREQSSAGPSGSSKPIVEIIPPSWPVPPVHVAAPEREEMNASAARASEHQATTTAADVHLEQPSREAPQYPVYVPHKMKGKGKCTLDAISTTKDASPPSEALPQTSLPSAKENGFDSEEAIVTSKPAPPELARNQPIAVISSKPIASGLAPSAEPVESNAAPTLDSATSPQTTEAYKIALPTRTDTPSIDASITTLGYVSSLSKLQALRSDNLARFFRLPIEMQTLDTSSFLHLHAVVKRIGAVVGVNAGVYDKQRLFFIAYTHEVLEEATRKVDEHIAAVWMRPEMDVPFAARTPPLSPPLSVVRTQSGAQAFEVNTLVSSPSNGSSPHMQPYGMPLTTMCGPPYSLHPYQPMMRPQWYYPS
ncbi:uncharacterized protein SPPG_08273 [Spizellomyces punctatus DAOM BR117]|uniref:Uncharacterized protein n=1 Tax=Spizellomyces punctatus (strain DAOM BR117) TaxID=645134 RepID=A0A0L0H5W9_SPIPD|nr:uncharacterized protein SPPG_08273 [Spizellomyces punctatus DAOM BR117]KNC96374.1 hypothetical protein SPPG_08273 [Spizellomyces punctatus DAOM BR117]|eukprot:XP_016604414.1 hypothetical protein SPPG_08273 [Spizellomyces punctatus DAOM BR117]